MLVGLATTTIALVVFVTFVFGRSLFEAFPFWLFHKLPILVGKRQLIFKVLDGYSMFTGPAAMNILLFFRPLK